MFAIIDRFKTNAVFMAGLVVLSVLFGWVLNAMRAGPLPLIYQGKAQRIEMAVRSVVVPVARSEDSEPLVDSRSELSLQQLLEKRKAASVTVLDARPAIFFGMGHVPGALSLPREDFEAGYARLGDRLKKGGTLVVYCSSETCEDAELVRDALVKLGHGQVMIFRGGWAEWKSAGLAKETTP